MSFEDPHQIKSTQFKNDTLEHPTKLNVLLFFPHVWKMTNEEAQTKNTKTWLGWMDSHCSLAGSRNTLWIENISKMFFTKIWYFQICSSTKFCTNKLKTKKSMRIIVLWRGWFKISSIYSCLAVLLLQYCPNGGVWNKKKKTTSCSDFMSAN